LIWIVEQVILEKIDEGYIKSLPGSEGIWHVLYLLSVAILVCGSYLHVYFVPEDIFGFFGHHGTGKTTTTTVFSSIPEPAWESATITCFDINNRLK
jgi:hypothetical protein